MMKSQKGERLILNNVLNIHIGTCGLYLSNKLNVIDFTRSNNKTQSKYNLKITLITIYC